MMIQIGSDELVGFHLSPPVETQFYDCQIFIGGDCVSDCSQEYLPGLAGYFRSEMDRYREKLNYLQYEEALLRFDDLTQIHNELVHSNDPFLRELKWNCRFLNWQMPLTDVFQSFLIPFRGRLWLTWQVWVDHESQFPQLDVVKGKQVCPYDIIDNFRQCVVACEDAE
ncbi:MAG: hypothetical protein AAGI63_18500 [Planctomycetota bacterium]